MLGNVGGILMFEANPGTDGYELWRSDGSSAGTQLVQSHITASTESSNPTDLVNRAGRLFFTANDGTNGPRTLDQRRHQHRNPACHRRRFEMGFPHPTRSPRRISVAHSTSSCRRSIPAMRFSFGRTTGPATAQCWSLCGQLEHRFHERDDQCLGTLFFSDGQRLWKSDGTSSGTQLVFDPEANFQPGPADFTNVDGTLFFTSCESIDNSRPSPLQIRWHQCRHAIGGEPQHL